MDYRSQGDQGMGYPCPNPIRVSAFPKPNSSASPKVHHAPVRNGPSAHYHHHHPHPPVAAPDPVPLVALGAAAATAPTSESTTPKSSAINYRECLHNHAAAIGGHVLDGCCEFMPSDADPLKCAACDCHRSFHRKQTEGGGGFDSYYQRRDRISVPLLLPPPHPLTHVTSQNYGGGHRKQQSAVVAFGGGNNSGSGATTGSSSEERLDHAGGPPTVLMESKKRFRTKFTAEQKEKMMGFAETVGWQILRQDKATVEQLCREVGVRRQVLKVWIHNNKHSIKKQQQ